MAHYAASGVGVTLLTCTLGEQGEILVPEYEQLEAARADQLGGFRIGELSAATAALGVDDHRFLGGAGGFRDSGMAGGEANGHPRAFWRAAAEPARFAAAVAAAVAVIREVRPQVVVTYDENGDYGHPDHVMAHRVTSAAVTAAADPAWRAPSDADPGAPWQVSKLYWTATPTSELLCGFAAVRAAGAPFRCLTADELAATAGAGVADDTVTTVLDVPGCLAAKTAALSAHRTQILVSPPFFALSNRLGRRITAREHFRLVRGTLAGPFDDDGRETDLFAGVEA